MKIISMSWTWPSVFHGSKSITCRPDWTPDYGMKMAKQDVVEAWTYLPRTRRPDAIPFARLRVIACRYEPVAALGRLAYEEEGFAYLRDQVQRFFRKEPCALWVSFLSDAEMRRILTLTDPDRWADYIFESEVFDAHHWVLRFALDERYDADRPDAYHDRRPQAYRRLGLPASELPTPDLGPDRQAGGAPTPPTKQPAARDAAPDGRGV
jgi:hypothetical protein